MIGTAINIIATFIVTFLTLFFFFRLGFMVGCKLTRKKLFPALSESVQRPIDTLVAQYHDANCDEPDYSDHRYTYQQVRTMLVIALTTLREN